MSSRLGWENRWRETEFVMVDSMPANRPLVCLAALRKFIRAGRLRTGPLARILEKLEFRNFLPGLGGAEIRRFARQNGECRFHRPTMRFAAQHVEQRQIGVPEWGEPAGAQIVKGMQR